jgi:AhpD family alkylhydroperoxidase
MHAERQFPPQTAPEGYAALRGVEAYLKRCGLPARLVELVKLRASQINGCGFCLDMHSRDARKHGETEQRLYVLGGWRDSPLYTPAERAALAWTEALTRVSDARVPDADYELLSRHFTDKEITDLTILIGMINLWNRVAIGLRYVHDVDPAGEAG